MTDLQSTPAHPVPIKLTRSSSLPSDLKFREHEKTSHIVCSDEKKPKVNRVKPVVQTCEPADIIKRNQKKVHTGLNLGKSEPSLVYDDGDAQSELSYVSTALSYRIHNKAFVVSGGLFGRDYRIDLDEYKEASDSSDDSDADYESESYVEEHRPRRSHHHWEGRHDFIFSMLAYNCNFNILWRFPYMALLCGGGSFLLVVILLTCLLGFPLLLLESSIGQLTRSGPVRAMERICTLSQGLGIAMSAVSFTTSIYSSVFLAWSLKLLVASANVPLRWKDCSHIWNDNTTCVEPGRDLTELSKVQVEELRGLVPAKNMKNYFEDSPIEQYFHTRVLDRNYQEVSSFFTVRGEIAACLVVLWLWVYVSTWKRRKTSQAWRQFTIFLLYTFIIVVLVKSCIETGGLEGIKHFFIPRLEDLSNPAVWCFGLGYVCNLYGLGFGVPMELAASNMFNHKNLVKDVLLIIGASLLLSILAGATVMAGAGNIAASKNIEINDLGYNIDAVFIVYIHMLSGMPFPQLFLIAFFTIFLTVGLSTQFFQLDLVISAIQDNFWTNLNKYFKSREILSVFVCSFGFILSLVFCSPAGQFLLYLTDIHVAIYTPVGIVAMETSIVFWVYGWRNILRNITEMTGVSFCHKVTFVWIIILSVSIFLLLMCQLVTSCSILTTIFTTPALISGAFLSSIQIFIFLGVFFKVFMKLEGKTVKTKLRIGLQHNMDECSCHRLIRSCPARSSSSLVAVRPAKDLARQVLWQKIRRYAR